jgi:hypothetical protein
VHSNLLKESHANSDLAQSLLNDLTLTGVNVTTPLESDTCVSIGNYPNEEVGEGVIISGQEDVSHTHGTPPVTNSNEKG